MNDVISQEESTLSLYFKDYQRNMEEILGKIGNLCKTENLSSTFIQYNLYRNLYLAPHNTKVGRIIKTYKEHENFKEINQEYERWMSIHEIFSNIVISNIKIVLNEFCCASIRSEIFNYIEMLHIFDVFRCMNKLTNCSKTEDNNNNIYIPLNSGKNVHVIQFYSNDATRKIECINVMNFKNWFSRMLREISNFNLSNDTHDNLSNYLEQFEITMQLDYMDYFNSEDILGHSYMIPDHQNAMVLLFRRFDSQIVDIQFISPDIWTAEENIPPNLENVPVTINKDEYKVIKYIKRRVIIIFMLVVFENS